MATIVQDYNNNPTLAELSPVPAPTPVGVPQLVDLRNTASFLRLLPGPIEIYHTLKDFTPQNLHFYRGSNFFYLSWSPNLEIVLAEAEGYSVWTQRFHVARSSSAYPENLEEGTIVSTQEYEAEKSLYEFFDQPTPGFPKYGMLPGINYYYSVFIETLIDASKVVFFDRGLATAEGICFDYI